MILADHHCHIIKEYYDDPLLEVKKLKEETNLEYIWSMGLDLNSSLECFEIKKALGNDEFLRIGFGFHPSDIISKAKALGKEAVLLEFEKVKELIIENQSIIHYVGEVGMDFSYPDSRDYTDLQDKIFKELCLLAKEIKKPVSIHCREAWPEVMEILDEIFTESENFNGFLHSFTGDFEQGMFVIEHGFRIGINGIITFKKSEELRKTIKDLREFYADKKIDEIFGLETDSPYLSPEPNRSEKNSPKNVSIVCKYLESQI